MRPGERPLAELSRALARAVPEAGGEDAAPWIADALDRLEPGERLVLLIDQFEEAFVACRDQAERAAFFDALVEGAGDPDERLVVVLAIRGDFYARCAEHAELSTLVSANQVLVGPMRRDELRRAIELPGRRAGLRIEPRTGLGAGRRRRRRARRPAAALRGPASSSGSGATAARCATEVYERQRRRRGGGRAPGRGRLPAPERGRAAPGAADAAAPRRRGGGGGGASSAAAFPSTSSSSSATRTPPGRSPCSPRPACSRSTRARSRSPTRRYFASGRACAAGSPRTPRAAAFTST